MTFQLRSFFIILASFPLSSLLFPAGLEFDFVRREWASIIDPSQEEKERCDRLVAEARKKDERLERKEKGEHNEQDVSAENQEEDEEAAMEKTCEEEEAKQREKAAGMALADE